MGTWIGHMIPGIFFGLFGLWWHVNNCKHYLRSLLSESQSKTKEQQQQPVKFRGSTTYSCDFFSSKTLRQAPIESLLKILITSIHFAIELITGYYDGSRSHIGEENTHHTAMLFGFFLSSWVEILIHYKIPLPKRTAQVMSFLAFAIEGVMMIFHVHTRNMIDAHVHQLLGLTIICSMLSALGECYDPNNFWLIVSRSYFSLVQGTWFIQAAIVIWPKTANLLFLWDPQSHRSISLLSMSYTYHLAGNAFLLIVVYLFVYMSISSRRKINNDELRDDEIRSDDEFILNINDEDNSV